jgi:hypothetical protein
MDHKEKLKQSYDELIQARREYNKCPVKLERAEKNYYTLLKGKMGYNNIKLKESVNKLVKKNEYSINKTPSQVREEKLQELYDKLLKARTNYKSAPIELETAENNYYTLKDGEVVYRNSKLQKYKVEAEELRKNMVKTQDENMKKAFESLAYYDSQRIYRTNINHVKLAVLDKIIAKIKEIQRGTTEKDTNNRKTFYMAQEQEWLTICIQFINIALISFIFVFIIYSIREHNITKLTYMIIIFLIFVTFYLETIVKWVNTIPTSINVYTAWGEDADQSTFLFWGVFMVILFVFGVLYSNNNNINNYFNSL